MERHGHVAVLAIDNAPVNALSAPTKAALLTALDAAEADSGVRAIVLIGANGVFSAGADIRELGQGAIPPELPTVISRFEASQKPVVAAIDGACLGGGLELALGCHYRIASPAVRLGLPEVKLGLLPGAGGTQRLPRIVGVEAALKMISEGEMVTAAQACSIGLVDSIVDRIVLKDEAIALAAAMADRPRPVTAERAAEPSPPSKALAIIDRYSSDRPAANGGSQARDACLDAVKASLLQPFDVGVQLERSLFEKLRAGPESRALRHIFMAEKTAARVDGLPTDTPIRPIETVAILGAGTMGRGIAIAFLSAGFSVSLIDPNAEAAEAANAAIESHFDRAVAKGRLHRGAGAETLSRLTTDVKLETAADRDLFIEAAFEDMAIKREIFVRLDEIAKPGAILATNTSYLDVDAIANVTRRPDDVLGLHFFSPAHLMRLLEIVRGARTSPTVLATAMNLAKRLGKVGVVAGVCDGFIGNRMMKVRRAQADRMLLEGTSPTQIDQVLVDFGFPMGPFQMADLAGLDLGWRSDAGATTVRERLCELGRRGQKTGAGYYDYGPQRERLPSLVVEQVSADFAQRVGVQRRTISKGEILERLVGPMIDEGQKILDEGIAQRASDIDAVWVNGFGWPRHTGGPMFWAANA